MRVLSSVLLNYLAVQAIVSAKLQAEGKREGRARFELCKRDFRSMCNLTIRNEQLGQYWSILDDGSVQRKTQQGSMSVFKQILHNRKRLHRFTYPLTTAPALNSVQRHAAACNATSNRPRSELQPSESCLCSTIAHAAPAPCPSRCRFVPPLSCPPPQSRAARAC